MAGFAFTVLGVILITILLEAAITFFSARGTIVRTKPRKPVVHLLHIRVVVFFLEIVLLIIGTVFALKAHSEADHVECSNLDDAVLITQIIVAVSWCVLFGFVVVIVIYLDPCHCYSAKVNYSLAWKNARARDASMDPTIVDDHWRLTHSVWEKRFRVACCFVSSDDSHQVAYKEVAEIFAHLFCDVNVVPSDIAAGMVLLQKEQFTREKQCRNNPEMTDGCDSLNFHDAEEREVFKDALHYVKFALGVYSWPFFVYMNPGCGFCRLCYRLQCPCIPNIKPHIIEDNACFCYTAGLRHLTGLNEMDLIYASFSNTIYQVPFFVCLDHDYKSVVISIRGTLSLHDIVTDLTASTNPIELPEFPNFLVHKGMLKTATWILEKLEEVDILEEAFSKVPNYKLKIVGHSLGSGCATLLALLLRNRYPDLYCYCYSPTGSLLNEAAADLTKDFVTSVTLGQDLVARLNVPSAHIFKQDLIRVVETCRKPKFQVLFEGALETVSKCCGQSMVIEGTDNERHDGDEEDPPPEPADPEDSLEFTPLLQRNFSSLLLQSTPPDSDDTDHPLVPLFPPGRVIHIVDTGEPKAYFCGSRQLEARWASRETFKQITVSPDMIRDHFPDVLLNAMNCVWQEKVAEIEDDRISRSGSTSD